MDVPITGTKEFESFLSALKRENIVPAQGMPLLSQSNNGKYIEVETFSKDIYKADHCWYNAKQHSIDNGGEVIFGWALWQLTNIKFVAQHHAIYRSRTGDYLDVTLAKQGFSKILFFIDDRTPFDYDSLRFPANFEYEHNVGKVWFVQEIDKPYFFIARLSGSEYVDLIRAQWKKLGVL